jgi:hypothetical protein
LKIFCIIFMLRLGIGRRRRRFWLGWSAFSG